MILDMTILDATGFPRREVSIGVNEHYELIAAAKKHDLLMFTRMNDYYEDAEFTKCEASQLASELETLISLFQHNAEMTKLLEGLTNLINNAVASGSPLVALSD